MINLNNYYITIKVGDEVNYYKSIKETTGEIIYGNEKIKAEFILLSNAKLVMRRLQRYFKAREIPARITIHMIDDKMTEVDRLSQMALRKKPSSVARKIKFSELSKLQLSRLREDITINSILAEDYINRYCFDTEKMYEFFSAYVEFLREIADDKTKPLKYDNIDNLYSFYSRLNEEDLAMFES